MSRSPQLFLPLRFPDQSFHCEFLMCHDDGGSTSLKNGRFSTRPHTATYQQLSLIVAVRTWNVSHCTCLTLYCTRINKMAFENHKNSYEKYRMFSFCYFLLFSYHITTQHTLHCSLNRIWDRCSVQAEMTWGLFYITECILCDLRVCSIGESVFVYTSAINGRFCIRIDFRCHISVGNFNRPVIN